MGTFIQHALREEKIAKVKNSKLKNANEWVKNVWNAELKNANQLIFFGNTELDPSIFHEMWKQKLRGFI